eukprot:Awhi_evm1s4091
MQRRRWNNGTFSFFIYLLFLHPSLIFRAPGHSAFFKITIYIQFLLQAIIFVITALSPAIFASYIYYAILSLDVLIDDIPFDVHYIGYGFLAVYGPLYYLALAWSTFFFLYAIAATIATFIVQTNWILIAVFLVVLLFPFTLALLHSLDVLSLMLLTFIPFYVFLPTFVSWFMAYAISRSWDLSWGNRPSGDILEIDNEAELGNKQSQIARRKELSKEKKKEQRNQICFRISSFCLLCLVILGNFGLGAAMVYFLDVEIVFIISLSIVGVALLQQVASMFYYLFVTDHMMTASLDDICKKVLKIWGLLSIGATISCLAGGVFTNSWVKNNASKELYGLVFYD